MTTYVKDPAAVLDYAFDWTAWLEPGETITVETATLEPPIGMTLESVAKAGGVVTVWLSGGTNDARFCLTCHVTTSAGRQDERSVTIAVHNR